MPARLRTIEAITLDGQVLNYGGAGAFLQVDGQIPFVVEIDGNEYECHLVRAHRRDSKTTVLGLQLDRALEGHDKG